MVLPPDLRCNVHSCDRSWGVQKRRPPAGHANAKCEASGDHQDAVSPPELKERVLVGASHMELQTQGNPAAVDYAKVCSGACDVVLYWRTLPWDHVGPALLLQEAGGVVRRPDGDEYRASERREGLLVASSEEGWQLGRSALFA
ncbi:inositol monophosphatase family protein [Ramlibacter sp. MMS24-I3-19]|uniref:inositol monophosphatase family protein n=1 Tax=Ramlibacter sp. MMS24-I3-19 TaxID=3416606 RepID=UPI003D02E53E